jgi:hypothetical protein
MQLIADESFKGWKLADIAASDAEGLLRVQFIKYVEGISPPPADAVVRRARELRKIAQLSLVACVHALRDARGGPRSGAGSGSRGVGLLAKPVVSL